MTSSTQSTSHVTSSAATSGSSSQPEIENQNRKNEKKEIYYKVAFEYKADNNDELNLIVGDIIKVECTPLYKELKFKNETQ